MDELPTPGAADREGSPLGSYRASVPKDQLRWQLGGLAPRGWPRAGGGDAWWQETQCLVQPEGQEIWLPGRTSSAANPPPEMRSPSSPRLHGRLRLSRLRRRLVQGTAPPISRDVGESHEIDFGGVSRGAAQERSFHLPGDTATEVARDGTVTIWETLPISGTVQVTTAAIDAQEPLLRVGIRVENVTGWLAPDAPREDALRASLLTVHLVLRVVGGKFVSLLDPPPWAAAAAAACSNTHTYAVLAGATGRRDRVLSAPLILGDDDPA